MAAGDGVEVLALARHLRELLGVGALKQVGREEAGAVVVLPTVGGVPHHLAPVDVTHSCRTQMRKYIFVERFLKFGTALHQIEGIYTNVTSIKCIVKEKHTIFQASSKSVCFTTQKWLQDKGKETCLL